MSDSISNSPRLELRDAHESAQLGPYLRDIWTRRSYVWFVAISELRNRQITTVLGNLWHLLNPALSIGVYYVIFGLVLKTTRGVDNFILFLTVGIFVFQFTQRCAVDGAKSIVGNVGIIRAIKFPRAMLPLTSAMTETMSALPSFAVVYFVAVVSGAEIRWQWLVFPLIVGVQAVFNIGVSLTTARSTTHFRDTLQILPFAFRLLLYASGVIFSVDAYVENSKYALIFILNPMYCFISIARWAILGSDVNGSLVISAGLWTIGSLLVGFFWFKAGEEEYARA